MRLLRIMWYSYTISPTICFVTLRYTLNKSEKSKSALDHKDVLLTWYNKVMGIFSVKEVQEVVTPMLFCSQKPFHELSNNNCRILFIILCFYTNKLHRYNHSLKGLIIKINILRKILISKNILLQHYKMIEMVGMIIFILNYIFKYTMKLVFDSQLIPHHYLLKIKIALMYLNMRRWFLISSY